MKKIIKEAVIKKAIETAQDFFKEFQCPLNSEETDWDGEAWSSDCTVVTNIDKNANIDEYWECYQQTLETETERLSNEYDHTFEIEEKNWNTKVSAYQTFTDINGVYNERYPVLTVWFKKEGATKKPVKITTVINRLKEKHPDLIFKPTGTDWQEGKDPWIYQKINVYTDWELSRQKQEATIAEYEKSSRIWE